MFTLAFNSFGLPFFYWVKIQICKIKAEIAECSGDWSHKQVIVFSSADGNVRLENSTELSVRGKMYDIVKTETRHGIKFYYAASDDDEDNFILKLANAKKKPGHEASLPVKAQKVFDVYFPSREEGNDFNSFPIVRADDKVPVSAPHFYPLDFKEIFSPPPNGLFT